VNNRRGFLKRCSILPFVGSLAAVAKAGVSESKLVCTWKGKLKCGGQNGTLCHRCRYGGSVPKAKSMGIIGGIFQPNLKLYVDIHNSKGEIVADYMPTKEVDGLYQVFIPKLENGCYSAYVYEESKEYKVLVRKIVITDMNCKI